MLENQSLQAENRQLSGLLKDYEGTLEAVMAKFRAHAHATQQHHLDLIRHYEGILLALPAAPPSPDAPTAEPSLDAIHLSLSLAHLASLIRKALRSLQGEDPEDSSSPMLLPSGAGSVRSSRAPSEADSEAGDWAASHDDDLDNIASQLSSSFAGLGLGVGLPVTGGSSTLLPSRPGRDESEGGYIGKAASTRPHYIHTTSTSSLVASPPKPGDAPLAPEEVALSQGLGPVDDALEREIEVEALRKENVELRRLLGISADGGEIEPSV